MSTSAHDDDTDAPPRRRYDTSGRQKDAALRRRRMLDAAHELFLEQGYGATSIEQIAQRAATSAQTVYAAFGNKAGVLRKVIDVAIAGDDADVQALERPEAVAVLTVDDPTALFQGVARLAAAAHRRSGELVYLVERVAGTDPQLETLRTDLREQLRVDAARIIDAIPAHLRRDDLPREHLIDVSLLTGDARTWYSLVVERGWTDEQYVEWFADSMRRTLTKVG